MAIKKESVPDESGRTLKKFFGSSLFRVGGSAAGALTGEVPRIAVVRK
jgi:hypothetical protein